MPYTTTFNIKGFTDRIISPATFRDKRDAKRAIKIAKQLRKENNIRYKDLSNYRIAKVRGRK